MARWGVSYNILVVHVNVRTPGSRIKGPFFGPFYRFVVGVGTVDVLRCYVYGSALVGMDAPENPKKEQSHGLPKRAIDGGLGRDSHPGQ